jgi:hypothetical protein
MAAAQGWQRGEGIAPLFCPPDLKCHPHYGQRNAQHESDENDPRPEVSALRREIVFARHAVWRLFHQRDPEHNWDFRAGGMDFWFLHLAIATSPAVLQ